jgi:hypothetical protein
MSSKGVSAVFLLFDASHPVPGGYDYPLNSLSKLWLSWMLHMLLRKAASQERVWGILVTVTSDVYGFADTPAFRAAVID